MTHTPGGKSACTHCGLPLKKSTTESAAFCCSGCYLAHHLGAHTAGEPDRLLARIMASALLAMGVMVFSLSLYGEELVATGSDGDAGKEAVLGLFRLGALALSSPILFLLGAPLFDSVVRLRRYLSSDALVLVATSAAWLVSTWNTLFSSDPMPKVYFDSAAMVLVLFHLGRWLDARARERARTQLGAAFSEHPLQAQRLGPGGETAVPLADLAIGDEVRLRPGDAIPIDGTVISGRADIDSSSLTGEETPRTVGAGSDVHAGTQLLDGTLVIRVTSLDGACVRDRIERLFERALHERAPIARISDRLAGALLPIVCLVALGTLIVQWPTRGPEEALLNAGCVVLIACPCALGIATPLAFWIAIGSAWKSGVLIRGGDALEQLAKARRFFLDKTGTLTDPTPELVRIEAVGDLAEEEAFAIAASLEQGSEHPLARSVRAAWRDRDRGDPPACDDFRSLPGIGVEGTLRGEAWRLGRGEAEGRESTTMLTRLSNSGGPDEAVLGLEFRARLRPEAKRVVAELQRRGLEPRVLTGDGRGPAEEMASILGIAVEAELLPADKAKRVAEARPGPVVFVGDGLNDAVAMATADVGIALPGGIGELSEAAEIHLLAPHLERLPELHSLAQRTMRIARANLLWAFAYNAIGIALAAQGALTPIFAASGMVLSSALVVLNSSRLADQPQG